MAVKRFSNSLISQSGQDKVTNFIAGYSPAIDEMDLIERVTVGAGGASSITFSNIPQTYQHLQVRMISRANFNFGAGLSIYMRMNGVSSSSYAWHRLGGDGATTFASGTASTTQISMQGTTTDTAFGSSIFGAAVIDVLDYAASSKTRVARALAGFDVNGAGGRVNLFSGFYNSTDAVSSITLFSDGNWMQHTTAALYGVKA